MKTLLFKKNDKMTEQELNDSIKEGILELLKKTNEERKEIFQLLKILIDEKEHEI